MAGADHELTLTFAQNFEDMFHSQNFKFNIVDADGNPDTVTHVAYKHLVVGKLPAPETELTVHFYGHGAKLY